MNSDLKSRLECMRDQWPRGVVLVTQYILKLEAEMQLAEKVLKTKRNLAAINRALAVKVREQELQLQELRERKLF